MHLAGQEFLEEESLLVFVHDVVEDVFDVVLLDLHDLLQGRPLVFQGPFLVLGHGKTVLLLFTLENYFIHTLLHLVLCLSLGLLGLAHGVSGAV